MAQDKSVQYSVTFIIFMVVMISIFITNKWIKEEIETTIQPVPPTVQSLQPMTQDKTVETDSEVNPISMNHPSEEMESPQTTSRSAMKEHDNKEVEIIYELPLKDDALPQ